jgi:hypothetical protein
MVLHGIRQGDPKTKKWLSCLGLALQNASFVAILRYTRIRPPEERFSTTCLVVFGEFLKVSS